jgi:hypothetical protein
MPIAACALRLDRELKEFGCPPVFPEPVENENDGQETPAKKGQQKKGKLEKKKSKEIYQWNILKELGVPEDKVGNSLAQLVNFFNARLRPKTAFHAFFLIHVQVLLFLSSSDVS